MFSSFIEGLTTYHFLQNALITSVAIGIVAGAIGCFIILRGMSLMGDAISHAVLPGVALSFILGINFFIGAIVFGILASVLITYISEHSTIKSDTAIGITFSSFLALGVILIGVANSSTDLFHILFGNVLAVQDSDKWITLVIAVVVILLILLFFRPLLITSFDPNMAKAFGMNVIAYSRTKSKIAECGVEAVELDELLKRSDVLTIHCPLTDDTNQMINKNTLSKMKKTALLINTSRGGVISEQDLTDALNNGTIAGACLDVITYEPMTEDCPLRKAKNCTITPHIAWAPKETRERLLEVVSQNIKGFINGNPQNVVNT